MSSWKEHVKNTGKNMAGKPLSMVLKEASKTWKSIKKTVKARYTFVIKNNLIISHHSSVQPN